MNLFSSLRVVSLTRKTLLQRIPAENITLKDEHRMKPKTTFWGVDDRGHILRTPDGGKSWKDASPPEESFGFGFVLEGEKCLGGDRAFDFYGHLIVDSGKDILYTVHVVNYLITQ
jgi:hypothetical protein